MVVSQMLVQELLCCCNDMDELSGSVLKSKL